MYVRLAPQTADVKLVCFSTCFVAAAVHICITISSTVRPIHGSLSLKNMLSSLFSVCNDIDKQSFWLLADLTLCSYY